MSEAARRDRMELPDYVRVVNERKWTIVVVTALVVAFGLLFAWLEPTLYRASARAAIKPLPVGLPGSAPTFNLDTESERAASSAVAEIVRDDLGTEGTDGLLDGLDVQPEIGTEILVFTYTDEDPGFAQAAANSFAQSYLAYRRNQIIEDLTEAQGVIQARFEDANDRVTQLESKLADARNSGDRALVHDLEAERSVLLVQMGLLRERLGDIEPETTARLAEGEILSRASRPSSPASPDYKRTVVLAAVLGLLLGLTAAFTREYLTRVQTTSR